MQSATETGLLGSDETTRVSPPDMVHPDTARELVFAATEQLPAEPVTLVAALGRVLAADIIAPRDFPDFAAATMDGFAVVAEDHSPWREIIAEQTAGAPVDAVVSEGYTVRITTGSPVPAGANAVVPVEDTNETENHIVIDREFTPPGENIRPVGFDLRAGSVVVAAGETIGPVELAQIASLGLTEVRCRRRPRVSILSTGDELLEPGDPPAPGRIYDANRFGLQAALTEAGADVIWTGKAPDNREQLRELMIELCDRSEIVVSSGGVSMGGLDLIKPLLTELADVRFRRVFLKPGKPLNFATRGKTLFFGLPGNPVSALVAVELYIRPAIRFMSGCQVIDRPRVATRLASTVEPGDRIEVQRAIVRVNESGQLEAVPNGNQGSSRLASFQGANALLIVQPRESAYQPGELLPALLLGTPTPVAF